MIICQKAGARFLKMDENHDQKKEQLQFNLYCIDIPPLKSNGWCRKGSTAMPTNRKTKGKNLWNIIVTSSTYSFYSVPIELFSITFDTLIYIYRK